MIKKTILFFILFISYFTFSQQNFSISGSIKSGTEFLPKVMIELKVKGNSKFAISNDEANYQVKGIEGVLKDSVTLKVNYLGYNPFSKNIILSDENIFFDVELEKAVEILKEIVIEKEAKLLRNAGITAYKINQKNFLKNAKATEVINSLPNVFYNKSSNTTLVEGTLKATIFIDGVETMQNEVKNIDAATIDKVEVLNNPTADYGISFTGAVINLITKKSSEQFFKGSFGLGGGIKNNQWSSIPSLNFKKGIVSIKMEMYYSSSDQTVWRDLIRTDGNSNFVQNSTNNTNAINSNFDSRVGLQFSKKSDLSLAISNGGYKIKSNLVGTSNLNNLFASNYSTKENVGENIFDIISNYKYRFNENRVLNFKTKYTIDSSSNNIEFTETDTNFFEAKSKNNSLASSLSYSIKNTSLFNKKTNISSSLKYVTRKFSFSNTDFYIDQNVVNGTVDLSTTWSNNFSTQVAVTLDHSNNKTNSLVKNYNSILPNFNAVYHFKNKYDVSVGYSKRVLRPDASDLNETLIISSPVTASKGNKNLEQQSRNYYFLKLDKEFNADLLSIKMYYESINNLITNVYVKQNDLLIRTFDNAAAFNATGMNFDFTTTLLKKINVNLNSGFSYNDYKINNESSFVKRNKGLTVNNSLSLNTAFFKDKVALSFSGMYTNPTYTLLSKTESLPFLDLNISTNLFKEKLAVSLYAGNLLGNSASLEKETTFNEGFSQFVNTRNNTANVVLTLTYNFGKTFESEINENDLQNNDLRK